MKKLLLNTILLATAFTVFAQSKNTASNEIVEEEIELPDVTTVVNGKTFTAGKDSVPDYTKILPENSAPEVQLPEMEGVKTPKNLPENHNRQEVQSKDIYAQGELGAGYPFYFKGDFSIYRASGNSPFEIDFNHEGSEGFARKKADEGYFARETSVKGKKSLFGEHGTHHAEGEYKMSDDGLQLKSDSFSDMVKHTIFADAGSDWETSNGFLISYGANGAWFNRYGEVMQDSPTYKNFLDSTKIVDLNPYLGFGWTDGDGFKAMLTGFYGFQGNLARKENLVKIEDSSSAERSHRGQFKLDVSWENDFISLGADGSVIFGTAIGSKSVLPACTARVDFKTESFTDDRFITISARGGIDSYQEKIRDLENKYKFAASPSIPVETTDFFTKIDLSVPILTAFEAKTGFEFKKTAFKNGFWQVKYKEPLLSIANEDGTSSQIGLYEIAPEERTEINTNLGFFADISSFKLGVQWKSFWKDLPSLEDKQNLTFSAEYQSLNAKWNAGASMAVAFGEDADSCPDLSAWTGVRLAPALSLAFEVNDVIKLASGKSRDWAHSQFITTSGNAVLLVKFQF